MEANPTEKKTEDPRGALWIKRWDGMKTARQPWDTQWQEIANYFLPGKANIQNYTLYPNSTREAQLFTTKPHDAAITCAAGLLAWTTPGNEAWFSWEPAQRLAKSDPTKLWLQEASDAARMLLAKSNFYVERHEDLLSHVAFATSAMYYYLDDEGNTIFESLKIGSYCIANNSKGLADTLYREIVLTARQAEQEFGRENLPENIAKCLDGDAKEQDKTFTFIHVVEPRPKGERHEGPGPAHAKKKAWVSAYVEKESKCVIKEGGYDRFPFSVGRWMKWETNEGTSVWGYGPGFSALPDARQLNFMRKMLATGIEKTVFPPIFVPDVLEGELDVSSRGVNYYPPGMGQEKVFPLNIVGNLEVGERGCIEAEKAVEDKFHVKFFQLFGELSQRPGTPPTATQIQEMAGERLVQISPAFARIAYEKDSPMLENLFEMWLEANLLPMPPEEAIEKDDSGQGFTPNPSVTYTSRLALAARALRNHAFDRSFARILQLAQVKPDILDNIDDAVMVRDSMMNDGVPAGWIRNKKDVDALQQQRAQAAVQQQQMQMLEQGTKAAGNLGKAPAGVQEMVGGAAK